MDLVTVQITNIDKAPSVLRGEARLWQGEGEGMGMPTPSSLSYISDTSLVSNVFLRGGYKAIKVIPSRHYNIFSNNKENQTTTECDGRELITGEQEWKHNTLPLP